MTEKEIIKAQLKAMAIFEANNTTMTVAECAKFLKCTKDSIYKRMKSGKPHERIYTVALAGGRIPKIQFLDELVDDWENSSQ